METTQTQKPLLRLLSRREVILALRLLLGVVFVWASIHKVQQPELLAATTRTYEIIPVSLSNLFAIFLAWSELFAGVLLIAGVFTRQSVLVIALLLVMFIIAICATMIRGMVIDCGCFEEEGGHPVDWVLLVRNILMTVAAVLVYRFDRGFLSLPIGRRAR